MPSQSISTGILQVGCPVSCKLVREAHTVRAGVDAGALFQAKKAQVTSVCGRDLSTATSTPFK